MRQKYLVFLLCVPVWAFAQNITVDSQTFTPQQLVEDILIDSDCISNILVTNVIGGNFGNQEQSYGYFNANGSNFPLQEGIVLTTGRLQNVPGPNTTLSDDDAAGWTGDSDLEQVLNETNTFNATILEFNFESTASEVRFRYLFASEEYQEGDGNTCRFSDLFGFLIRQQGTQTYENIALVPNTDTPVKVTTVHPEIPGECEAVNEFFFDTFNDQNDSTTAINFNGQTKVLEATAIIQPNTSYEVKLVIADETNARFDSAVFLEAGSFQLGVDLGEDRTILNGNPVCGEDSITLTVNEPTATAYQWFQNGNSLTETSNELEVIQDGFYEVTVTLANGCEAFGEVTIEFTENPTLFDSTLNQCDLDGDGLTQYNLFDAFFLLTGGQGGIQINSFFIEDPEIVPNATEVTNPRTFNNTTSNQVVFAQGINQLGCTATASLTLTTGNVMLTIPNQSVCDEDTSPFDGITSIDLDLITMLIQNDIPANTTAAYYLNESDALSTTNELTSIYTNTTSFEQTLIIRLNEDDQCVSISEITIEIISPPLLLENETITYCLDSFPELITLESGITGNSNDFTYDWLLDGNDLNLFSEAIDVNETGLYTVIVTNENGCSNIKEIDVQGIEAPLITDVTIENNGANSTVTVITLENGNYEYSIESEIGPYQDSSIFSTISPGFYTIYVRDIEGCGIDRFDISVLGFPAFFTPNGDNYNDFWQVEGSSATINPIADISIFDRFGKLVYNSQVLDQGWNGKYNGAILPINDYWYKVTLQDGRVFTGHISLLR